MSNTKLRVTPAFALAAVAATIAHDERAAAEPIPDEVFAQVLDRDERAKALIDSGLMPPPGEESTLETIGRCAEVAALMNKLSDKYGTSLEDLATAFLAIRPELSTDEQAFEVLASIAAQSDEMGLPAPQLAALIVEASKKPDGQVVVHAGDERTRFSPEGRVFDGTPDTHAAQLVGEGAARYHLESLAQLDAEGRGEHFKRSTSLQRPFNVRTPLDRAVNETQAGCGSAGCRSFAECLCTCKKCKSTCTSRKP